MSTTPDIQWMVLLDEDEWEHNQNEGTYPLGLGEQAQGKMIGRSLISFAVTLSLLLVPLLVMSESLWNGVQVASSQERLAPVAPPVSADLMAARSWTYALTEHLRFGVIGTDGAVVAASAPALEELYLRTFAAVGIAPSHGKEAPDGRLLIRFGGANPPVWSQQQGRVDVPLPASPSASVAVDRQVLLRQAWLLALIDQATREVGQRYQTPQEWLPLLAGLRIWLLLDAGGPLADGWNEVVVQLYGRQKGHLSAAALQPICQQYAPWDLAPIDFSIPLRCGLPDAIVPAVSGLDALGLPESFDTATGQAYGASWQTATGRSVAVALLLQYAVEIRGREVIPALLAALHGHSSWQTLIPAVFGVSATEFEAGWRAYLADQYDVSLEPYKR